MAEGSDLNIEGGEGGDPVAVTLTPQLVERYVESYRAFSDQLARFCMERGAGLVRIDAERPVIDQLDALFGTMVHR